MINALEEENKNAIHEYIGDIMNRAHEGTYDLDVINDDLDHIDLLVA